MKKTIIIIISCFLFSIMLVAVLYGLSGTPTDKRQNFVRLFQPDAIREANVLDIKYNSYYIAGATTDHIYLGNSMAKLHMLVTNTMLSDTQHVSLNIENIENYQLTPYLKTKVKSPYFYLMDGNMPGLFRGKLGEWQANRFMYDSLFFIDAIPISPSSFAVRAIGINPRENVLGKETTDTPHVELNFNILEKQIDGLFCTDGKLHYNKELNQLIYIYTYRGEYLLMDTSLSLLSKGKTIDTISQARIKPADIASENSHTLASPPAIVNRKSCTSGNWLFVHSNLLAKNEREGVFNQASVIDVYNLATEAYQFSLYLYDRDGKKVKEFRVFDRKLIAIYDHYLVKYELNDKYFPKMEIDTTLENET